MPPRIASGSGTCVVRSFGAGRLRAGRAAAAAAAVAEPGAVAAAGPPAAAGEATAPTPASGDAAVAAAGMAWPLTGLVCGAPAGEKPAMYGGGVDTPGVLAPPTAVAGVAGEGRSMNADLDGPCGGGQEGCSKALHTDAGWMRDIVADRGRSCAVDTPSWRCTCRAQGWSLCGSYVRRAMTPRPGPSSLPSCPANGPLPLVV